MMHLRTLLSFNKQHLGSAFLSHLLSVFEHGPTLWGPWHHSYPEALKQFVTLFWPWLCTFKCADGNYGVKLCAPCLHRGACFTHVGTLKIPALYFNNSSNSIIHVIWTQ